MPVDGFREDEERAESVAVCVFAGLMLAALAYYLCTNELAAEPLQWITAVPPASACVTVLSLCAPVLRRPLAALQTCARTLCVVWIAVVLLGARTTYLAHLTQGQWGRTHELGALFLAQDGAFVAFALLAPYWRARRRGIHLETDAFPASEEPYADEKAADSA